MSNQRIKKIEVRVSETEKKEIIIKAENVGLSVSEYLRKCALLKKIKPRFSDKEIEAWQNLTYISYSLKNMSNLISKDNREEMLIELKKINEKLKIEIEKFVK